MKYGIFTNTRKPSCLWDTALDYSDHFNQSGISPHLPERKKTGLRKPMAAASFSHVLNYYSSHGLHRIVLFIRMGNMEQPYESGLLVGSFYDPCMVPFQYCFFHPGSITPEEAGINFLNFRKTKEAFDDLAHI